MAGQGPIQVIPPGLLGFLQLKVGGMNPGDLSTQLGASLELFDWYMQATAETVSDNTASVPANSSGSFRSGNTNPSPLWVPSNQWWYVQSMSFTQNTNTTTADRFWLTPAIAERFPGAAPFVRMLDYPSEVFGFASAQTRTWAFGTNKAFWAPPSSGLGAWIGSIAAANGDWNIAARITRLPI